MWRCVLVLALVGACKEDDPSKRLTPTSEPTAREAYVDEDYRFRIAWPGADWKVLREADVRRLHATAIGGLMYPGTVMLVIVEPASGQTAAQIAASAAQMWPLADKTTEIEPSPTGDVRVELRGTEDGRPMAMTGRVLVHDGYGYQVLAGGEPGQATTRAQAIEAFTLLGGAVRPRARLAKPGGRDGLAWRLRDGAIEDVTSRLRVPLAAGRRVLSDAELALVNRDAALGFVDDAHGAYAMITAERLPGVDPAPRIAHAHAAMAQTWTTSGTPAPATVAGQATTLHRGHGVVNGLALEIVYAVVFVGDRQVQVSAWFPAAQAAAARPRADTFVTSPAPLAPAPLDALIADRTAAAGRRSVVGADFVLRDAIYTDFAHRLRWRAPPGLWRVRVGDEARAANAIAPLLAHELVNGVWFQIAAEPWPGSAADYEAAVQGGVRIRGAPIASGATRFAGGEHGYLDVRLDGGGVPVRSRSVVAARDGRGVQAVTWTIERAWPTDPALVDAPAAAVELVDDLVAVVEGPPYVDHRFGFRMDLPPTWRRRDERVPGGAGIVSSWTDGHGQIVVTAAPAPVEDETWAAGVVEQILRDVPGARGTPSRSPVSFGRHTGERLHFRSGSDRIEALLLRRDQLFYVVLATNHLGAADAIGLARAGFSLVE